MQDKGIIIGKKLAEKLRLNLGDYVKIISSKSYETLLGNIPREATFKIIGFFEIGMYEYDTSLVFLSAETNAKIFKQNSVRSLRNFGKRL